MPAKAVWGKIARTDFLCIGIIVLTVVAFHGKVVQGKAVFPFDYECYHYPLLSFIGHELSNGRFPTYDPYVYSGVPFCLNTQASLYYPVHLVFFGCVALFKAEPTQYLINLLGIFHFILGGIFFYCLARYYGIRRWLSAAGALLYSLNGHVVAQSQHLGIIETFAWLPLLFLLSSKFVRKPQIRTAVSTAIVAALIVLIGFLPLGVAVAVVLFIFMCSALLSNSSEIRQKLAGLILMAVIVVCLTAVVTIPMMTADQPMERLGYHPNLPASSLKTLLWPNIFKALDWSAYTGEGDPTVTYLYPGLAIPLFAFVGLFVVWKKAPELAIPFIVSAAVAFSPVLESSGLYSLSYFFVLVRPENFVYFTTLFGVLLSLMAMEFLWTRYWVIVAVIAVQAAVTIIPMTGGPATKHDKAISIASVLVLLVSLAVVLLRQKPVALIPALAAAHLFAVNVNSPMWTMRNRPGSTTPDTIEYTDRGVLRSLRKSAEPYRVAVDYQNLGGYWNGSWRIWRIENIGGFEPIRSQKYLDTMVRELSDWNTDRLFNVVRLNSPFLNLLNVKFLVGRSDHPPNPLPAQWRKVHDGFWEVYENQNFHARYAVVPMESVQINQEAGVATYLPGNERAGRIEILAQEPGHANISITVQPPKAFLFISERNYRGWEITIDGKPVEPLTVNELVMGIPVVRGEHRVQLRFKMPHRYTIILLTSFGLCLTVLCLAVTKRNSQTSIPKFDAK